MPASFGVQGPGESTIASGALARISAMVSASLRATSMAPQSGPIRWTRFHVKES